MEPSIWVVVLSPRQQDFDDENVYKAFIKNRPTHRLMIVLAESVQGAKGKVKSLIEESKVVPSPIDEKRLMYDGPVLNLSLNNGPGMLIVAQYAKAYINSLRHAIVSKAANGGVLITAPA